MSKVSEWEFYENWKLYETIVREIVTLDKKSHNTVLFRSIIIYHCTENALKLVQVMIFPCLEMFLFEILEMLIFY